MLSGELGGAHVQDDGLEQQLSIRGAAEALQPTSHVQEFQRGLCASTAIEVDGIVDDLAAVTDQPAHHVTPEVHDERGRGLSDVL